MRRFDVSSSVAWVLAWQYLLVRDGGRPNVPVGEDGARREPNRQRSGERGLRKRVRRRPVFPATSDVRVDGRLVAVLDRVVVVVLGVARLAVLERVVVVVDLEDGGAHLDAAGRRILRARLLARQVGLLLDRSWSSPIRGSRRSGSSRAVPASPSRSAGIRGR